MTRKTNTVPNPKRYPGKFVPTIVVSYNTAEVRNDDVCLGAFALRQGIGAIPCGCKRCRDGKTADTGSGITIHDMVIERQGVKKADLTFGHIGGGLNVWKREMRKLYPSLKSDKEFKGLKLVVVEKSKAKKTTKKTAAKKSPAKKTAVKKTAAKKSPAKKTAAKKTTVKKTTRKARKPATKS